MRREKLNEALSDAAEGGDMDDVRRLLKQGADPDAVGTRNETVLFLAAREAHVDVMAALVAAGADVGKPGVRGVHNGRRR